METVDILLQLYVICGLIIRGSALTITSVHCAVRKEISPCTCFRESKKLIKVQCEGMTSFEQVVSALEGKFEEDVDIALTISHSKLEDLQQLSFKLIGISISSLYLNYDNLSYLPETVFAGIQKVEYFSLANNALPVIPQKILQLMPKIKTLDLQMSRINNITSTDFNGLPLLKYIILYQNNITFLEEKCFPPTLVKLQLGRNHIKSLNGTLRSLNDLDWLALSENKLESLEGELPETKPNTKLKYLSASNNCLSKPPQDLRHFMSLDNLWMEKNRITTLDGALSNMKQLKKLVLTHNQIAMLAENEFAGLDLLEVLQIAYNNIKSLNGSLLPLKSLKKLNLSHNNIQEFSLQDIRGLTKLDIVDLSYNSIHHLSGRMENLVELETRVYELRLEYNKLQTLSGSLMGLNGLHRLNLSHNCLETILPEDLIGLDDLKKLDISYNHLTTLEETSKTVLPSLEVLLASHNWVRALEKDFHGLPRLCSADLSHNKIETISTQLDEHTQCQLHNVNSTLRIYLQGNPVLCDKSVTSIISVMEAKNYTKIHGSTDCQQLMNITSVSQLH